MSANFGDTRLPRGQQRALGKARRLEWVSIVFLAISVAVVAAVMGSSQAMKAAWIEDCLSFLPPIAFLVALRRVHRRSDDEHRFGHHRAVGAAHLAASVALLAMGSFLLVESAMTLVKQEHPTIGTVQLFGHTIWLGWLMIAAMAWTAVPPVVLGRMKMRLAEDLHDKVLYADADMNKADWSTAAGAMLGVLGIGIGWWWADSVVAGFIAVSIVRDGWTNLRNALDGLTDVQARTFDDSGPHPAIDQVERYFLGLPWVERVWVRMRDMGHVFHTEVFVVPTDPHRVDLDVLARAGEEAAGLDWKLDDLQVVPVAELPESAGRGTA